MRLVACVVVTLILAGCSGAHPASAPLSTTGSTPVSPSLLGQTASASPAASSSPIVGEWVRTASCDEALAAFVQAGLIDQIADWVTGNYVGEAASTAPGKECTNAKAGCSALPFLHGRGSIRIA